MPPQPLSKVRKKPGAVFFHAGALSKRPDLALGVMHVIDTWAWIDTNLAQMLSKFLKADFVVVSAMLQALRGAEGKRAALQAAAHEALPPDDLRLYQAVMRVIKPSRDRRNEFAHHLWGIAKGLDDALLLLDPKHSLKTDALIQERIRNIAADPLARLRLNTETLPAADHSNIMVYRKPDVEECVRDAARALEYVVLLSIALTPNPATARVRSELSKLPPIRQALQQMSNGSSP